jgi:hypothetical protein
METDMPGASFLSALANARSGQQSASVGRAGTAITRHSRPVLGMLVLAALLAACSHAGAPGPGVTTKTNGALPAAPTSSPAAVPPAIVAVTTRGALVTVDPTTGIVTRTLVPGHVLGDEISVSATGLVYFAARQGSCNSVIEGIPISGGSASVISTGTQPVSLPAVSPDGTKLAYAQQPSLTIGCVPSNPNLVPLYSLVVRTLSTGATKAYPMVPSGQDSELPAPISHLSWATDNDHLAVSVSAIQDNEGWNLVILDTAAAQYYLTGPGTTTVPATGEPSPARSYLREGVFMPNGNLFVSRACCAGVPVRNTSRLMWEVSTNGALIHEVAIGYPKLDHTSLDVSSDGQWLLYLAGHDLYISHGGARPNELTGGLIAAAWS